MKIIFYSTNCKYCLKLLEYLDKHNIKNIFKLVDIDKNKIPKNIKIVPTLIDTDLNQPLTEKSVFDYVINLRYFNNPTNNIDLLNKIQNPNILEDNKALKQNYNYLEIV